MNRPVDVAEERRRPKVGWTFKSVPVHGAPGQRNQRFHVYRAPNPKTSSTPFAPVSKKQSEAHDCVLSRHLNSVRRRRYFARVRPSLATSLTPLPPPTHTTPANYFSCKQIIAGWNFWKRNFEQFFVSWNFGTFYTNVLHSPVPPPPPLPTPPPPPLPPPLPPAVGSEWTLSVELCVAKAARDVTASARLLLAPLSRRSWVPDGSRVGVPSYILTWHIFAGHRKEFCFLLHQAATN